MADGLRFVAAVKQDAVVARLYDSGNYEDFGRLLATEGMAIQSAEDARDVWDAFCDAHGKAWYSQGIVQAGQDRWDLGVIEIDNLRYWYEVKLDEKSKVVSARLQSRSLPKR